MAQTGKAAGRVSRTGSESQAATARTAETAANSIATSGAAQGRPCLLILGMHRSGTSMLARMLNLAGFRLPHDLFGASPSNPFGHWEPQRLIDLHDALLEKASTSWRGWQPVDLRALDATEGAAYRDAIAAFLRDEVPRHGPLVLKEPRTCLLAPMTIDALDKAGGAVSVLLPYRNPAEVAASLHARNTIPPSEGVLIWLRFVLDAEHASRGVQRAFLSYDRLLTGWRDELGRAFDQLGLALPAAGGIEATAIDGFVTTDARHHRADAEDLGQLAHGRGLASDVLAALDQFADDPQCAEAIAICDKARARLDEIAALAGPSIAAAEAARQQALGQVAVVENQVKVEQARAARLEAGLDGIGKLHEAVSALNSKNDAFIADLRLQLERAAHEASAHKAELATAREEARALEAELAALQPLKAEIDTLRQQCAAARAEAEQLRNSADEGWARVRDLEASTSWRVTAPLRGLRVAARAPRRVAARGARTAWTALPIPPPQKARLKTQLFTRFSPIFRNTGPYQRWAEGNQHARSSAQTATDTADPVLGPAPSPVGMRALVDLAAPKARAIAFYLPQFHPIPENDEWWGEGFTEWTNVRSTEPQFPGHYQPRIPGELGYYDLRDPEVMRRQIDLARRYGLGGFCFYWYWFGGHRLLETPVQNWLADPSLDFPFCICWANENWSRRWDGLDSEILIAQKHSPEDDLAFIAELAPYLRDPRYIRVDGRPLIVVYRPSLLPDPKATAARWRGWCRENGIGEIHLAYTQSFESADPAEYGFDAAIEFPPNNFNPPVLNDAVEDKRPGLSAMIYDWTAYLARSRDYPQPDYRLYRSVNPSWDNTARRKGNGGAIFLRSNPDQYREWLENAVARTVVDAGSEDDRLIFINAWNEWAEGAYLEPDQGYGYAWLQATRDALDPEARARHVTLVGHDAHANGAQYLLLNLARRYRAEGFGVTTILKSGGPLAEEFEALGWLQILDELPADADRVALLVSLRQQDGQVAIANTAVTGDLVPDLKAAGYKVVSLIHEMRSVYEARGLGPELAAIREAADRIVFPSRLVQQHFEDFTAAPCPRAVLRPQGLYMFHDAADAETVAANRTAIRKELGIPEGATVVLGVGYMEERKGVDLFAETVVRLNAQGIDTHGIWIGDLVEEQAAKARAIAARDGLAAHLHLPGFRQDVAGFYHAADLFLLTSREDPYPSVVIEAMSQKLPVILFEGATGSQDLADRGLAVAVTNADPGAMADAAGRLIADPEGTARMVEEACAAVSAEARFTDYAFDLLDLAGRPVPRVSVIVPNYNYARYMPERIGSIIAQDHPIHEIIVLDDASTDDSLAVLEELAAQSPRPIRIIPCAENSGNVFRQWQKGVAMAQGDYIWIAEADDVAEPDFLSTVMAGFEAPGTVLSYTDSTQIDADGRQIAPDYRLWVDKVDPEKWARSHASSGRDEVTSALYLKNTIPNASAVVMRANALREVLAEEGEAITAGRYVGDWLVYLALMKKGGAAFLAESKNRHRRHEGSVTLGAKGAEHLAEIAAVQKAVAQEYALDTAHREAARAYRRELAAQFNLPAEAAE